MNNYFNQPMGGGYNYMGMQPGHPDPSIMPYSMPHNPNYPQHPQNMPRGRDGYIDMMPNHPMEHNRDWDKMLTREMDDVWQQHVIWTRMVILGILMNLPNKDDSVKRLLQNPADMAKIFSNYYPHNVTGRIRDLFTEHLTIGAEIITAVKENNHNKTNDALERWYRNGDEIAKYFASINSNYDYRELRKMFFTHLDLTKDDVLAVNQKMYARDVHLFDQIEQEALMMADYFVQGLLPLRRMR